MLRQFAIATCVVGTLSALTAGFASGHADRSQRAGAARASVFDSPYYQIRPGCTDKCYKQSTRKARYKTARHAKNRYATRHAHLRVFSAGAPRSGLRRSIPQNALSYRAEGKASWYGENFHGRRTANGEIYDMGALSAAHRTLPFASYVRVTNLENQRSVVLRVNDRGPYHGNRLIDVSVRAAKYLGFYDQGLAKVRVEALGRPQRGRENVAMKVADKNTGRR
jgi:rare lipoprotein A (peptidoglycan hydrolase)